MISTIKTLPIIFTLLCIPFLSYSQDSVEQIWVTFESLEDVPVSVEGKLTSTNPSVQALIETYSINKVEQVVPTSSKESLQKLYEVSCHCDADALSQEIENRSSALTNPTPAPVYTLLNDPNDYTATFQSDYALDLINAKEAWQHSTGDETTVIGISDANYYAQHEELEGKIAYLDPVNYSTNFYHGTAVAITAAGHTNNGIGKSSIGYNCKLSLTAINYGTIVEMSQEGIRVINISWSSGCTPNGYVQAIVDEVYENGTVLVAAAGNGNTCGGATNPVFPAACDKVISVTSVGANDNHEKIIGDPTSTHQHHSTVDICAPGYNVPISPLPGFYNSANGTSFAAPFVSGTIGLMVSLRPCLTPQDISEILRLSSDDIYTANPNYVGLLGSGRLNAEKALELTKTYCSGGESNVEQNENSSPINNSQINDLLDQTTNNNLSSNNNLDIASSEEIEEFKVNVYPNPTAGSATLQWHFNETMELSIMDARGSIVKHQELLPEMDKTEINVLESGVYFLKITRDNEQVWFGKLIKL